MKKIVKKTYMLHKYLKSILCTTFKKNERMDFCIDFLGRVLYIYVMKAIQICPLSDPDIMSIEGVYVGFN